MREFVTTPSIHPVVARSLALALTSLLCSTASFAQSAATPPSPPPPAIVLKAAHLFDSTTGKLIEPGIVIVSGKTIAAVGDAAKSPADAKIIDLGDATLLPGFIDAHVHMIDGGAMLTSVHLHEARSKAELVATVQEYARSVAPGTWITGGGWDHTHWGGMLPDRSWLDAMTPDNPVWIERVDGHMALANSAALRAAGVTRATPDVAGGVIVRDPAGEPTGLFRDNALELVGRAVPPASGPARDRALEAAMTYLAGNGVTSVTSIGSWDDVATFERARDRGVMRTRINAVVPLRTWARLRARIEEKGRGDVWLRVGGLKGFADGSLGARTAWMLSPGAVPA